MREREIKRYFSSNVFFSFYIKKETKEELRVNICNNHEMFFFCYFNFLEKNKILSLF